MQKYLKKTGKLLPMEGESKKAARAGSSSSFYWENENPDAYFWHKSHAAKKLNL